MGIRGRGERQREERREVLEVAIRFQRKFCGRTLDAKMNFRYLAPGSGGEPSLHWNHRQAVFSPYRMHCFILGEETVYTLMRIASDNDKTVNYP